MKILALVFLLLTGCGYQFVGGQLPGDSNSLYVPLAINETTEPLLENTLAGPVTAVLARQRGFQLLESEQEADAILSSVITEYTLKPISYGSDDRITEFQSTLKVHYALKQRQTGKLLWQSDFTQLASYRAATDKNAQEDLEAAAIETMVRTLADDLVYRLVTRF